jgi:hypothetical protein
MSDLECPYCGAENEVNHDDGQGYDQDRLHQIECSECEKVFTFTTSVSFYYEPYKADCLNDGKHDFKWTATHPKEYSRRRCSICEEYERGPEFPLYGKTQEEIAAILS